MKHVLRAWQLTLILAIVGVVSPGRWFVYGVTTPQAQQSPHSLFAISIIPMQNVVPVGSPVMVKVLTVNTSTEEISFTSQVADDPAGFSYTAEVRNDVGNEPPETPRRRMLRYNRDSSPNIGPGTILQGSAVTVSLKPGEEQTLITDVGKLYDFTVPGKYRIQVERAANEDPDTPVKSNAITITIRSTTASPAPSQMTQPPFVLTIAMHGTRVQLSSPIGLQVVTKNISDKDIVLWADKPSQEQAGSTYQITVENAAGTSPPQTEFGRRTSNRTDVPRGSKPRMPATGNGNELVLKPGETWTDTILVNELYNLNQPDEYAIQVERYDPATGTMVKSNKLTVTVTP